MPFYASVKTGTTVAIVRQMENQQRTSYVSDILLVGCILRLRLIQAQLRWTCPERNLPRILTLTMRETVLSILYIIVSLFPSLQQQMFRSCRSFQWQIIPTTILTKKLILSIVVDNDEKLDRERLWPKTKFKLFFS